jgi:hypothetical protein
VAGRLTDAQIAERSARGLSLREIGRQAAVSHTEVRRAIARHRDAVEAEQACKITEQKQRKAERDRVRRKTRTALERENLTRDDRPEHKPEKPAKPAPEPGGAARVSPSPSC